jgi:hypothetical protein
MNNNNNAKSTTSQNITRENIARMYGDRPMNKNVINKYQKVIEELKGEKKNIKNIVNLDLLEKYSPEKLKGCYTRKVTDCEDVDYCKVKRNRKSTRCIAKNAYELGILVPYKACPYHETMEDCEADEKCSYSKKTKKCRSRQIGRLVEDPTREYFR